MRYLDKHGNAIKAGMTLRHDDGTLEIVYKAVGNDLGFNASNEDFDGFTEAKRELYPLSDFNLAEWEIVK